MVVSNPVSVTEFGLKANPNPQKSFSLKLIFQDISTGSDSTPTTTAYQLGEWSEPAGLRTPLLHTDVTTRTRYDPDGAEGPIDRYHGPDAVHNVAFTMSVFPTPYTDASHSCDSDSVELQQLAMTLGAVPRNDSTYGLEALGHLSKVVSISAPARAYSRTTAAFEMLTSQDDAKLHVHGTKQ